MMYDIIEITTTPINCILIKVLEAFVHFLLSLNVCTMTHVQEQKLMELQTWLKIFIGVQILLM